MIKNHKFIILIIFGMGFISCVFLMNFKNWYCSLECDAQHLYKNDVFYRMRGQFYFDEKAKVVKLENKALIKNWSLERNGLRAAFIYNGNNIIMLSKINDLVLVARPIYEDGRVGWYCDFFSKDPNPPKSRRCAF